MSRNWKDLKELRHKNHLHQIRQFSQYYNQNKDKKATLPEYMFVVSITNNVMHFTGDKTVETQIY